MTRTTLALFWLAAGAMHFIRPRFYDAIMPPPLRDHARTVTYASGAAELVGAALALAGPRRLTRWYLLLLLAAVYPANVWMALEPACFPRAPRWALIARLPVQFLFAWHAIAATRE
ncbi:MAG TPA: hypothetical protein VGV67_06775 [Solirubrobacteraceae bacterium]|nr:hypothetical protein [Solirubrobacteraceae bacterium]